MEGKEGGREGGREGGTNGGRKEGWTGGREEDWEEGRMKGKKATDYILTYLTTHLTF